MYNVEKYTYICHAKCMNFCLAGSLVPQKTANFHNVSILPSPDTHNTHSNIQYQYLSILPSPDPHNKHSNIQYQYFSILPSPDPHNQHSNIKYQFLSILHSPDPHNKHSNIQYQFLSISHSPDPHYHTIFTIISSLSVQIATTFHAIKTDCGVGVTAVGYTCSDVLVIFGDRACKSGNIVS